MSFQNEDYETIRVRRDEEIRAFQSAEGIVTPFQAPTGQPVGEPIEQPSLVVTEVTNVEVIESPAQSPDVATANVTTEEFEIAKSDPQPEPETVEDDVEEVEKKEETPKTRKPRTVKNA